MTTDASLRPRHRVWRRSAIPSVILVATLVVLGAVLRFRGIADRGLWLDEAFSVLYAHLSWSDVIELRRSGTNPPLFHFLLSLWVRGFGDGEASVRALSGVFGVVSIWAIYGLARRLTDRKTALIAAAVLCLSNMAIAYSRDARFYAMTGLWSILTTWALHAWVTQRQRRHGVAYILLMVVFVWLHTFAWLVLAAHGTWLAWQAWRTRAGVQERRRLIRGTAIGFGVVMLAFVPWIPILLNQVRGVLADYWIERPSAWTPLLCLYEFLAPLHWLRYGVAAVAAAVTIGVTVRRLTRSGGESPSAQAPHRVPYCLLITWLVVPVGAPFAWSLVGAPVFQIKYAIVAQPAAVILFAGLARRATVSAMIILALVSLYAPWGPNYPLVVEDWREAARLIDGQSQPGTPVYMYRDYCYWALTYYLERDERVIPVYAPNQSHSEFDAYYPNGAVPFDELLRRLRNGTGQAWMVIARIPDGHGPGGLDSLRDELSHARPVAGRWPFRAVEVLQFEAAPAGSGAVPGVELRDGRAAEQRAPTDG